MCVLNDKDCKVLVSEKIFRNQSFSHPPISHTSSMQEITYFILVSYLDNLHLYLATLKPKLLRLIHLLEINPAVVVLVDTLLCLVF